MTTAPLRSVIESRSFQPLARTLRREFEARFADPKRPSMDRFTWDHWTVPGQYNLLRTPARGFFEPKLFNNLTDELILWGEKHLGCTAISEPWMSCYTEGHSQGWHCDEPHGPFAFVLSLTPWKQRVFRGGRTLLLRDSVLDHWSDPSAGRGFENAQILEAIEPRFGELIVFDPRIPHAVEEVRGALSVLEGRLVLHGWFTEASLHASGRIRPTALTQVANRASKLLQMHAAEIPQASGLIVLRLKPSRSRRSFSARVLVHTLRPASSAELIIPLLQNLLSRELGPVPPGVALGTEVTIPFFLER